MMLVFQGKLKRKLLNMCILAVFGLVIFFPSRTSFLKEVITAGLIDATGGVQRGLIFFTGSINDWLFRRLLAQGDYEEVLKLQAQLHKLAFYEVWLKELYEENLQLKQLIKVASHMEGGELWVANVIGRTGTPLSRLIQIDIGKNHNLSKGDAVMGESGAVGRVYSVGQFSSEVLLLTDTGSAIDVMVQRSRANGIVRGKRNGAGYMLAVNDFDRLEDVRAGDIIITSGIETSFPAGVPLGEVLKVYPSSSGLTLEAEIKPYTNFSYLERVLILPQANRKASKWYLKELIDQCLEFSREVVSPLARLQ